MSGAIQIRNEPEFLGLRKGRIFVISGPSGVGKGTVIQRLLRDVGGITISVSATTREPRTGEVDGVNYHFLSEAEFIGHILREEFFEFAKYSGNMYGTLKHTVEDQTRAGVDLILEIDIQGARQVKAIDSSAVLLYIQAPTISDLEHRLRNRGTETEASVQKRIKIAQEEQVCIETDYRGHYIVVNDEIEACTNVVKAIVLAERHRLLEILPDDLKMETGSDVQAECDQISKGDNACL